MTKTEITSAISNFINNNTLTEEDYPKVDNLLNIIDEQLKSGIISREDIHDINLSLGNQFIKNTVQGYGLVKPFGYAGDFLMIDKIYTNYTTRNNNYIGWDNYFHSHSAPKAVRNRKEYFINAVTDSLRKQEDIKLLNIASGPARDVSELYEMIEDASKLKTTCIDFDQDAINYASSITKAHSEYIEFVNVNILRYCCHEQFDIVWSAGLFDYFEDGIFVKMLRRFKNWVKPGGQIIIGNFNEEHNPSRKLMEIFGEWFLIHRSEEKLIELAMEAGYEREQLTVGREQEQVNLFLHIQIN